MDFGAKEGCTVCRRQLVELMVKHVQFLLFQLCLLGGFTHVWTLKPICHSDCALPMDSAMHFSDELAASQHSREREAAIPLLLELAKTLKTANRNSERPSPPVSAQQADLICYWALLKEGDIRTDGGAHVLILGKGQFHHAVDESQSEAQFFQTVSVRLLSKERRKVITANDPEEERPENDSFVSTSISVSSGRSGGWNTRVKSGVVHMVSVSLLLLLPPRRKRWLTQGELACLGELALGEDRG